MAAWVLASIAQGCSLFHVKNDLGGSADAGDSSTVETSCSPSRRVCFAAPKVSSTSWGITSVLARSPRTGTSTATLIVAAHGASEVVELKLASGDLQSVSHSILDVAPWQVSLGDFDLDGIEDLAVASPGTGVQVGEVSFWRAGSSSWSKATSQKVGLGTYAIAVRMGAKAGDVVAVGASYVAQTLVPLIAHASGIPTAGTSISLDIKPTALAFGSGLNSASQLYIVGSGPTHGRLLVYDGANGLLTRLSKSEQFGQFLNDLKLGDLNGDSILDAVIIDDSEDSEAYSLTADNKQNWTIASQHALPANSHAVTLADFDRDGKLDIATISGSTTTVQLCFGDGRGAFGHCELLAHGIEQPTDITSIDLDSDHWIDVVVVGYEGQVSILRAGPPEV